MNTRGKQRIGTPAELPLVIQEDKSRGPKILETVFEALKIALFRRRVLGDRPRPSTVSRAGCRAPAPPSIERRTLRLRDEERRLARQGDHEAAARCRKRREALERSAASETVSRELGHVQDAIVDKERGPLEHRLVRMEAEDALWARAAFECLRSLSSGAEQERHAAAAAAADARWQDRRARYRELAGADLEPELKSRDAQIARLRAHGAPRSVAQRNALVERVERDLREGRAYRHSLVMKRAGLRVGTEAYNLPHLEASIKLGRLAPSLEATAIGGKR